MGAEHKLDLTSDVTHLLVGDTNTPKYKYVAREREDVKVLKPEWVQAVRECWMNDEDLNLNALEAEFTLPTLAGLSICITGFDDLTFRAQLQKAVTDNGGSYTGDLTKSVTHLIAAGPEGKKYQYATQWQMKVVSLKWLKDSLDRGMQLEETLYHPTTAKDDQGRGAWNREAKMLYQLGKRVREEQAAPEPARKLRRSISAKLSSQTDDLWDDIVGRGSFQSTTGDRQPLRPSKSMPTINPDVQETETFVETDVIGHNQYQVPENPPRITSIKHGFFDNKYFCLHGFDSRQLLTLKNVLLSNGAVVLDSLEEMDGLQHLPTHSCFLIVPYRSSRTNIPALARDHGVLHVVTELWIECCMSRKDFVEPDQYPLGNILSEAPVNGFEKLRINSTGFPSIELLHVSKLVALMGAKYDEVLKPGISVLVCNPINPSVEKMRHAHEWRIPVVSAAWLWSCINTCQLQSLEPYLLGTKAHQDRQNRTAEKLKPDCQEPGVNDVKEIEKSRPGVQETRQQRSKAPSMSKELLNESRQKELGEKNRPGSDFHEEAAAVIRKDVDDSAVKDAEPTSQGIPEVDTSRHLPLQEVSKNSPSKTKSLSPGKENKKKKQLFRSFDGQGSIPETNQEEHLPRVDANPLPADSVDRIAQKAQSLNGAIQDLLNMKAAAKLAASSNAEVPPKRKLLGRALSNLSNSSIGSKVRPSRAGSVDSVNTDGLGSELVADPSQHGSSNLGGRGSFPGRAKSSATTQKRLAIELSDPGLYRDEYVEEEVPLQMTQLGYEDPEETIMLRAKLAEKRRGKSRIGQEDTGVVERKRPDERRIRDDEALLDGLGGAGAGGGWGTGRRTRQKDRSPQGLDEF